MINLARVVNNPKVATDFIIYRKKGEWSNGRFEEEEKPLPFHGTITIAKPKEIEMIPEGDRVGGELIIHCSEQMFTTREGDSKESAGTSDEVLWNEERYKIYAVGPRSNYGYYRAIAMRKDS